MTNLEWLKQDLTEEEKEECTDCTCIQIYKKTNGKMCKFLCGECTLRTLGSLLEFLSQDHKEPVKLKKWENDLIRAFDANNYTFEYFDPLKEFKEMGYFSGVKDVSMKLGDILDNCEIVPDNYEGFKECK